MIAALKALLNPTAILAILAALMLGGTTGAYFGYEFRLGKDAQQKIEAFDQALKDTRTAVVAENAAANEAARKQESLRASARVRKHNLDLELAKDESARNCHINDASFGVLSASLDQANAEIATGGVDAGLPAHREAVGFIGLRPGAVPGQAGVGLRP